MTTIDPSVPNASLFSGLKARGEAGRWVSSRATRVCVLVGVIVLLSLTDLYLTLLYLRSVGMSEANPLAHMIMSHFSADALTAWKILTVALSSVILIALRKARSAEIAAWLCAVGLCMLTVQWYRYSRDVGQLTPVIHKLASMDCAKWVHDPH